MAAISPPSPAPASISDTLSARINTATRNQHTTLNKLITSRLQLALPPTTTDPALLHQGLAYFTQIYITFEYAWQSVITQPPAKSPTPKDLSTSTVDAAHRTQIIQYLTTLRPPGLARTPRITRDQEHLSSLTHQTTTPDTLSLSSQQLILDTIHAEPHILFAYAWVLYMAIFSGGRWIRQQLGEAGGEFWGTSSLSSSPASAASASASEKPGSAGKVLDVPGFSFLSFDGALDGEDIKDEFKARLAEADVLFTEEEKRDAVDAAGLIFETCIGMVHDLDRRVWRQRVWERVPAVAVTLLMAVAVFVWYGREWWR